MMIPALDKTGKPITVEFVDEGEKLPAFNLKRQRFDAYTSRFRVGAGEWTYVQMDARKLRKIKRRSGPAAMCEARMVEDFAAMEAAGIDTDSLDFDKATDL